MSEMKQRRFLQGAGSAFAAISDRHLDKAQALRQAMLTTKDQAKYSQPLDWAAFTLIGEAE